MSRKRTVMEITALLNDVYYSLCKEPYVAWPSCSLRRECLRDTSHIHDANGKAHVAYNITTPFFELKISAEMAEACKRRGNVDYSCHKFVRIPEPQGDVVLCAQDIVAFLIENDMWVP